MKNICRKKKERTKQKTPQRYSSYFQLTSITQNVHCINLEFQFLLSATNFRICINSGRPDKSKLSTAHEC